MRRISVFAIFLSTCLCATVYAQSKSYTGAGELNAGISPTSSLRIKEKPRSIEDTQPVPDIITFPALNFKTAESQSSVEEKVDVPGAKAGDKVELFVPRIVAVPGLSWTAWVNTDNEVTIRFTNFNETPQSIPAFEVFKVRVIRK